MKLSEAYEAGKIVDFLGGITTAGLKVIGGMEDIPTLEENLPINRYSVPSVVEKIKRLLEIMEANQMEETLAKTEDLKESLASMEEYLGEDPSPSTFLMNAFAEKLVITSREIEKSFRKEMLT